VLTKMIFKLMFKATLPLVIIVGFLSYGLYTRGGDPLAVLSKVASSAMGSARTAGSNTAESVQSLATFTNVKDEKPRPGTVIYQWTDANGVAQFSSHPPQGVGATAMNIRTATNHRPVAPAQEPQDQQMQQPQQQQWQQQGQQQQWQQPPQQQQASTHNRRNQRVDRLDPKSIGLEGDRLPGMAGMQLPANIDLEDLGLKPEDVLKLLQGSDQR